MLKMLREDLVPRAEAFPDWQGLWDGGEEEEEEGEENEKKNTYR